jgi:hypothetical protein
VLIRRFSRYELLSAAELREKNVDVNGQALDRWEVMLGRPGFPMSSLRCTEDPLAEGCGDAPSPPFDPFMIESIAPRTTGQMNPISGDVIVAATSFDPLANNINGHELDTATPSLTGDGPSNDILQFACIFTLEVAREQCSPEDLSCECGDEPTYNRPVCNPPGGGASSNTQYFERAVPGTRILQVLKDAGDQALVASICPKVTDGSTASPYYGYNPAFTALGNLLGQAISDSQ